MTRKLEYKPRIAKDCPYGWIQAVYKQKNRQTCMVYFMAHTKYEGHRLCGELVEQKIFVNVFFSTANRLW